MLWWLWCHNQGWDCLDRKGLAGISWSKPVTQALTSSLTYSLIYLFIRPNALLGAWRKLQLQPYCLYLQKLGSLYEIFPSNKLAHLLLTTWESLAKQ